jgi:hypothetical protein
VTVFAPIGADGLLVAQGSYGPDGGIAIAVPLFSYERNSRVRCAAVAPTCIAPKP